MNPETEATRTPGMHGPDLPLLERVKRAWRYRELVRNLTRVNLLVKYRGSVLGMLWSLVNPLLLMLIYSIAFRFIMRVGLENYELFLLSGLLPWTFFALSTSASSTCVIFNGALLKKVHIPHEVFPLSTVAFHFTQLALSLAVFVPFAMLIGGEASWISLSYLLVLALFLLFTMGVSLAVSALTVRYRDVQHFTEVGLALIFWLTPVVYNFELIPDVELFAGIDARTLFLVNPLTLFMNSFHDALYWNRMPDGAVLGALSAWTALALAVGSSIFRRIAPTMAEEI